MFDVVPQNDEMLGVEKVDQNGGTPWQCPKRLCQGPCSEMVNGRCGEALDQKCVWLEFDELLPASATCATAMDSKVFTSKLKTFLQAGDFVHLCEIHSPKSGGLSSFVDRARQLSQFYDALIVTGQIKGRSVLPSSEAAGHLRAIGVESIAILSGCECDSSWLAAELAINYCNDVQNVVCLTGEHRSGRAGVSSLDAVSMLQFASSLPPERQPWLGAVINPDLSTNKLEPLQNLKQKIAAGANYVLSQMIFDTQMFADFCQRMVGESLDEQVHVIAGIPVVVNEKGLELAKRLPGVVLPQSIESHLRNASDMAVCGIVLARLTIEIMKQTPGVSGVNVMLLGDDNEQYLSEVMA